jgi:hypothetical protein
MHEDDASRLDEEIESNGVGNLLRRTRQIDFAAKAGYRFVDDVTAEEFVAHQMYRTELDRYHPPTPNA